MNLIGPEMSPGLNVTMTVLIRNVFVLGKWKKIMIIAGLHL